MERGASVALDLTTDTVSIWDKIVRLYLTVEDVWVRLNKGKMELKAVVVPKKNLVVRHFVFFFFFFYFPSPSNANLEAG